MSEQEPLAAGRFGEWLVEFDDALSGKRPAEVACGDCSACCTSSQFVHIAPEEERTLARVPRELLFPAPGLPRGHVVLGYDDRGHCPMLVDGRCSIYDDRPRTCRTYDCRVFAAAAIEADKGAIAARAGRWSFEYVDGHDRRRHEAVRAAGRYLRAHRDELPAGAVPANPTQLAVLAVRIRHLFLSDASDTSSDVDAQPAEPELDHVRSMLARLGRR